MPSVAAFVLAAALGGCGEALHDATHPVLLSGEDARVWIDAEAGAMIAARHPGVDVGHAHCPFLLNLTGRRVAECTIPVAGSSLRIGVHSNTALNYAFNVLSDVDAIVVKRDAERELADKLTLRYGVPFAVRCDGPPVRVLPVRTSFTCGIDAPTIYADRIDVEAVDRYGSLWPDSLKSGDTREVRMLGRDVAERTQGGVTIAGPVVERYVHEIAGGPQHGELVRRRLLGAARCPPRVALSGSGHATCTVRAGRRTVAYDLRFDQGRGLVIQAKHQVEIIPALRELARRYYEYQSRLEGKPTTVSVDCGREDVVLTDPGQDLPCTMRSRNWTSRFTVQILDANGNITFDDEPPDPR